MKAVDAVTLQVSVISSSVLELEMVPKTEDKPQSVLSPRRTHSLNSSPAKQSIVTNGLKKSNDARSITSSADFSCLRINGSTAECSGESEDDVPVRNCVPVSNGFYRGEETGHERRSLESLTDAEVERNGCGSPPKDIPRYHALQVDSGVESAASSWDRTVAEVREQAEARLTEELRRAREELKLKDEQVLKLSRIRQEVESELEELTASLFQEAHNMVRVANERQAAAEKGLKESTMQVEVLTAEVAALKTLVLTSTPSRPNPHLHPQIDPKAKDDANGNGNALFRKHRRSPSHFNLKYGRENSPPDSPVKEQQNCPPSEPVDFRDGMEVDPVIHREFLAWRASPTLERADPFLARVYREDIDTCLDFTNTTLAAEVRQAVESGDIYIEAVNDKSKTHFPKKCALLEAARQCQYRMRLGEVDVWHSISHICRNRIIAVCDFLNYLKYIQRGLVKSSVHDVYWEMVRLRKEMVLARLGLPLTV